MTSPPANRWISRSSSASISPGGAVAGQHDLAPGGEHRVGHPQQLGLHLAPVGQELDVIQQQEVDLGEPAPVGVALAGGDGGVKGLDEIVEGEVLDAEIRIDGHGGVPHRHLEVGLAQSGAAVDEQRVVDRARGLSLTARAAVAASRLAAPTTKDSKR